MEEQVIIGEMMELGYSKEESEEMIRVYRNSGCSGCYHCWPERFTLFSSEKNVADIFLKHMNF